MATPKKDKTLFQHLVDGYRFQTPVLFTRGFLCVVDGHTRAARKIGVEIFVFVPHWAVKVWCFGTEREQAR